MITIETFVHILDLGGTFVFAISGAVAAVNRRLDIFGILVLSFVAGNFGGIGRDVLIGAVPPAALSDGRYLLVSVLAGLITFFSYAGVNRLRNPVLLFDAVGLSFFAVAGAQKAITFGLSPVMSALLGMLTGIGGGMTRDVLLTEIPQSATFGSIRRRSVGRRLHRRHRQHARNSLWCLSFGWWIFVLRPSLHGDQVWLAIAGRSSFGATTRRNEFLG
jgi:Glycine transporter